MNPSLSSSSRGFSLLEIMVVVVIIGLLASMAIPSFTKIRRQSRQAAMLSDGRVIASAAQHYFMTTGKTQVQIIYDSATGIVTGDLTPWLQSVTKNYNFGDDRVDSGASDSFSFSLPNAFGGVQVFFSEEGKTTYTPDL